MSVTHDIAAQITARLGFVPEESLVLACTRSPAQSDGLIVRIDLAALADPADRDALLARVLHPLRVARAAGMVVAYFTGGGLDTLAEIDAAVDDLLSRIPAPRRTTVVVDSPAPGPDRQSLAVIPPADARRRRAALAGLEAGGGDMDGYMAALALARTGARVPADLAGRLGGWLADPRHRDAVIVLLAGPEGAMETATDTALTTDAISSALGRVVDPSVAVPPGPEVAAHVQVLTDVIAVVPAAYQVAPRTVLGFIAWWAGHGALADRHLAEALAIDNDYRLAWLLQTAVETAIPPGWTAALARPLPGRPPAVEHARSTSTSN